MIEPQYQHVCGQLQMIRSQLDRALERLEGVSPDGSLPEPCCRTREAGRRQGDPQEYASELALPDQATGGGWVPASRPPDEETSVIVADANGEVGEGYICDGEWWWSNGGPIGDGVTDWMFFPEPPRAQSEVIGAQGASCPRCGDGLAEDGVCENLGCPSPEAPEAEGASGSGNTEPTDRRESR